MATPITSRLFLAVLIASYAMSTLAQENECKVTIENGEINGIAGDTADPSRKVCNYLAIPYAKPPVGAFRFKPPQPADAWGSMDGTKNPNWCPQTAVAPPGYRIAEDCLYLNVHSPVNASSDSNLPVMIWFHGGSFTSGSAQLYTPNKLLSRGDVILVVVHYRLGLLGFLSTGDEVSPGNYGLKDMAFSIKWVHENIRAFGGNTGQVTIFGESAGGAAVLLQTLSPLNKGLIHGAIAESGTAISAWVVDPQPAAESVKIMAARLGCPTGSSTEMVNCLSNVGVMRILLEQAAFGAQSWANNTIPFAAVTPVVEPNLPGAFISEHPLEIMKNGEIDNIPVVLGANKHDGSFILGSYYAARVGPLRLDQNPEYLRDQLVPDLLHFFNIEGDEANRGAASSLEIAYLSGVNRSSWDDMMPGLVDIMTVFTYKSPAHATADLLTRRGIKVYLYSLEHHSLNTLWTYFFGSRDVRVEHGITHGDDMMYLFDYPAEFNEADQRFSDTICDLWINFGTSGNPTPSTSDRYDQWPVYNFDDEAYMKLNVTPTAMLGYRSSWRPNGFEWN